jgi:hypothetical protein
MRIGMRLASLLLLLLFSACTSRTGGSAADNTPRLGREPTLITADELERGSHADLYTAVQALRPVWLRKRGPVSINSEGDLVVYLDNMRLGGPASLHSIDLAAVKSVRFLPPTEAQARFGLGHPHGAILVFTRS